MGRKVAFLRLPGRGGVETAEMQPKRGVLLGALGKEGQLNVQDVLPGYSILAVMEIECINADEVCAA